MTGDLGTAAVPIFVGAPEIITAPLDDVIDSENFTPRLLALLSNALVWRESRLLRRAFNLGTNDWRVISALSIRPGATSSDISEFVAMNKAVVSKSVNTLIARELIVPADGRARLASPVPDPRRRRHARPYETDLDAGPGDRARRPQSRRSAPAQPLADTSAPEDARALPRR